MLDILKLNSISKCANGVLDGYNLTDVSQDPVGILVRSYKMDDYQVPSSLLAIARAGAGVNNIPHAQYAKQGICVFNTPGANANAVKELVILDMLLGARNVAEAISWTSTLSGDDVAKQVEKGKSAFAGNELQGKTVCILGLGAIGTKVAKICYAFDMNVVAYDPHMSEGKKAAVPFVSAFSDMQEACKNADFVTLHLPYLPETKHLINSTTLKEMKDGVIIINAARGELVDNEAIKQAIACKKVRKYIVDFPNEECINCDGIIAIPHLGASTEEAEDNCAVMAAEQLKDYIENGNVKNSVNMPNVSLKKSKAHRATIISHDDGKNDFGGVSATRDGICYTIVESDDPIDITSLSNQNTIKARIIY